MLTNINLENYRAFEQVDLPLSQINIFLGPNNSGKSSLISPLTLFSQTLQSPDIDNFLLMSGKYEDLGTYYDMVYSNDTSKIIKIRIQADLTTTRRNLVPVSRGKLIVKTEEIPLPKFIFETDFKYRRQRHEIILDGTFIKRPDNTTIFSTRYSSRLGRQVVKSIDPSLGVKTTVFNNRFNMAHFIPVLNTIRYRQSTSNNEWSQIRDYLSGLRTLLSNLEYIGPFRAYPERTYLLSGESPSSIGKNGEKAVDILVSDEKRRGKQKRGFVKSVSEWLNSAGIAKSINVESLTDRHFEILIQNVETGELENLADTGFGCSQVLPILLSGFTQSPGNILAIQQPELHLHPKAQAELGSFINMIAQRGVQLIVETHSEHLLLRLQSHVAEGSLKPESVNVFYFDTDVKTNKKTVQKIELDENGLFKTKWPKGFFPERLNEAKRLAKLSLR